jgi:2-polyprenyl-6-methoxyphenol hydroxylase-like FAD-dependent oxidoreductase
VTLSTSVNRQTFREILAARLGGALEFGRAATGFEQDADQVTIDFRDGSRTAADVLVAADGSRSAIRRRYLPRAQVRDTGTVCVYGRTPLTGQARPLVPAPAWDGFTAVVGSTVGLAAGVLDFREPPPGPARPYLMWAVTGRAGHFAGRLGGLGPAGLHAAALQAIRRWHPDLVWLVRLAAVPETTLITIVTAEPVAPWPASRVTLLGDAIHAMSPAGGSGANTALRDAALLAAELGAAARGEKGLLRAIGDYEQQMSSYGFAAVRASRQAEQAMGTRRGALAGRLISRLPAPR